MKKVKIYFDGACRNVKDSVNEPYGIGVAVFIEGKFSTGFSLSKGFQNGGTSNIAEWEGCLYALRTAEEIFNNEDDFVNISIFSDSEIITKQFNGEYKVKEERFKQYYERCLAIAKKLKIVSIIWVPREYNKEADKLSKEGLNSVKNDNKKIVEIEKEEVIEETTQETQIINIEVNETLQKTPKETFEEWLQEEGNKNMLSEMGNELKKKFGGSNGGWFDLQKMIMFTKFKKIEECLQILNLLKLGGLLVAEVRGKKEVYKIVLDKDAKLRVLLNLKKIKLGELENIEKEILEVQSK